MNNKGLIAAIIFATIAVAGSLIFLGTQLSNNNQNSDFQASVEKGIKAYIEKQQAAAEEANKPPVITEDVSDDDPILGDKNAPVTIVEFSDYQCPYCRSFFNDTLPLITEKYIKTGKAKLIYRDLALPFHADALPAAVAAECARKQKGDTGYFAYHDKIFEGQNKLGQGTVEIPAESLQTYAREMKLNMTTFNECVKSEEQQNEAKKDTADAARLGINGTPAFVINGTRVDGAQPFSAFEQVIEAALQSNN